MQSYKHNRKFYFKRKISKLHQNLRVEKWRRKYLFCFCYENSEPDFVNKASWVHFRHLNNDFHILAMKPTSSEVTGKIMNQNFQVIILRISDPCNISNISQFPEDYPLMNQGWLCLFTSQVKSMSIHQISKVKITHGFVALCSHVCKF